MFIKIGTTNFFIITDNKTPYDIYREIIARMNKQFISKREKGEILQQIYQQL